MDTVKGEGARQVLQGVIDTYRPKRAKDLIVVRWIYRPLSFHATVPAILLGLSPNAVTVANLFLVILAASLLISTEPALAYTGATIFFAVFIVDCMDGNIARYLDKRRYFGKLLDGFVDVIVYFLYLAIAVGNVRRNANLVEANIELAAAVAIVAAILLVSYFRARLTLVLAEVRGASKDAPARTKSVDSPSRRFIGFSQRFFENLGPAGPLFLLATLPWGMTSYFLLSYAALFVLFACAEIALGLMRYRRILDVPRPQ